MSVSGPARESTVSPGESHSRSSVECSDAARMPHCKDPPCGLSHVDLTGTAALRGGVGGNADALESTAQHSHGTSQSWTAMPHEWSMVRRSLGVLLRGMCHEALAATPPIVQGCCSFAECIDSSVQYAHRLDVDAIAAVGHAQLALGKGLDTHMMSEHAALVERVGLTAALNEISSRLLPVTLQPRPHFRSAPPSRHASLPVMPHPALRTMIQPQQREEIRRHQELAPMVARGVATAPREISERTASSHILFVPER
jgi:hypothetical protein